MCIRDRMRCLLDMSLTHQTKGQEWKTPGVVTSWLLINPMVLMVIITHCTWMITRIIMMMSTVSRVVMREGIIRL